MKDQIRNFISEHGHLSVDLDTLPDDADLHQAGMTSDASISVMIAIEDTFDVARRGRGPGVSGIVANERIHATDVSPLLIAKEV